MKAKLLFILLFVGALSYGQLPTTDLIKAYSLTNGSLVNDINPGSHDLIPTGTARTLTSDFIDRANEAVTLNGDSFDAGVRGTSVTGREDITLSFWIKTATVSNTPQRIIEQNNPGGGSGFRYGWHIDLVDGKIKLSSSFLANGYIETAVQTYESQVIADGYWHHVMVVLKRAQFYSGGWQYGLHRSLYIDNDRVAYGNSGGASSIATVYVNPASYPVLIANGTDKFTGAIDNLRIYNRQLTEEERRNVYKEMFDLVPRFYVDLNASGSGNSSSWANAMKSLYKAVYMATNQEIWVKAGTYKPDASSRSNCFDIASDNVKLYGGFNGTESNISERDILNNPTILSGDLNGNDTGVSFSGNGRGDNAYNIIKINANNIEIDGVIIQDGHANEAPDNATGAGILVASTANQLSVKNCTFKNNVAQVSGAIRAYFDTDATVTIENCTFDRNMSKYANIYLLANANRTVGVNITNCLFTNNESKDGFGNYGYTGSAAWIRANATNSTVTTTITNCTFANNTDIGTRAGSERGVLALGKRTDGNSTHNATISNCIFYNNVGAGGATTSAVNKGHTALPNTTTVFNSIDEDNFSNLTSLTNTSNANPMFVNATGGDFKLQSGSPAIDTGDNSKIPAGITTDVIHNIRIHNTTVDMGAYEFNSVPLSTNQIEASIAFMAYPNPVIHQLNIIAEKQIERIEVYNYLGQKIMETKQLTINTTNLAPGMYVLKVHTLNNGTATKRFIKR